MSAGSYDPADHTVADVLDYAAAHPDQIGAITDAELAGRNRVTLVDGLTALARTTNGTPG